MAPRKRKHPAAAGAEEEVSPGDVPCDFCFHPRLKAVKSCLVCLASLCESHLQPHLTKSGLKSHRLVEPVENLEDRLCPTHERPLELFCATEKKTICMICSVLEHKDHRVVPLNEACEQEKASLPQSQSERQRLVEQRRLKVQQVTAALELSDSENHREAAAGLQAFTVLMQSVQSRLDHFLEQLQEKQRHHQRQAQELLQELQQELCELEKSSSEAQQLSLSTDPLHFLQRCSALPPAGLKDWSSVSFEPQTCAGSAARALSELEKDLSEEISKVFRGELRRVQQYAVDVTLDPDSAHAKLVLSQDLRQVHHSDQKRALPDGPRRFSQCCCVVGKQSFSSGQFYFQVQVKGKTEWDLGVVRESIDRKGKIALKPRNGQWVIWLRGGGEYRALAGRPLVLTPRRPPQKVGVFVDYAAGLVSFYDADSADLIFSFSDCSFEERLLPYFSPCNNDRGKNSAALVLTPLSELRAVSSEPETSSGPQTVRSESKTNCEPQTVKSEPEETSSERHQD